MYIPTIGLEVHCELKTNSKNFSGAANTYSEIPNSHLATVDLGLPGILPVINENGVKQSIKMALAMHCEIPTYMTFERKNYFYPDLPKGYQITQFNHPIGTNGYIMIYVNGEDKKVYIHDTHLEEDTASLDHYGDHSLIDYNRAGVPLLETVTEPCMHSALEAIAFLESLRSIFLYCDASEARTDRGQIRCDVNVSLAKEGEKELGTKVEIKNVNSFNNVKDAITAEIKRQTEILEQGGVIAQETRRYDENNMCTYAMRSKEDAIDYRYFTEPNIPPIKIEQDWLEEIRSEIPLLQYERITTYMEKYGLSRYDATILVKEKEMAEYFEETIKEGADAKAASNWITSVILGHMNKYEIPIPQLFLTPKMLVELIELVTSSKISSKQAKEVLYQSLEEEKSPASLVKELGIEQIGGDEEILAIVKEVFAENVEAKSQYQAGRTNIVDFLVGQVMKKTKGKANPATTRKFIQEEIVRGE